ncbi:hypothetical protein [Moritella yayanosii]|uniref:Uncharacterized protein n=1 Tax=Moritella yayanosii TaxID=69539 RepID=A0A330LJC5_9GAMM|nr:hypothetical protein [Moritella yayanosii]SQD76689.1 conserved protein of unknown function [Moritella yayanosii]
MSTILLCNKPIKADALASQCGIDSSMIFGAQCRQPSMLTAYTPYLIGTDPSNAAKSMVNQLTNTANNRELTNIALSFGGDNTLAIADISAKLQALGVGTMGASTSFYGNRVGGFADAVKSYQAALMEYRHVIENKVTNSTIKTAAKQKAMAAFQKMQQGFHRELKAVTGANKSARGTPLTSGTRGTNIARSSRNVAKLNITSQIQTSNLVKFSQHAKFLGGGLAVIDFTSRVGNIHHSYKAGQNWERKMFIESSSFLAATFAGTVAVEVGSAALAFIMVGTPVGWVGLIVGGLTVVGVAAGTAMLTNSLFKENSGDLYDEILNWMNS